VYIFRSDWTAQWRWDDCGREL